MSGHENNSNDKYRPGAGLPWFEQMALGVVLNVMTSVASDRYVLKKFRRESRELLRLAEDDESYDAFHALPTARLIGIEHSSCKWSVMMVLEHLCMTTSDMFKIVKALDSGVVPHGEIDIADYKPSDEVGFEVLDKFRQVEIQYAMDLEALLESKGRLETRSRYRHPWFGLLNAHQWHCLAAVHLQIHRRQMQKIIAMLGVT